MNTQQINAMLDYIHQANQCMDWTLKLFDEENDPKNFRTVETNTEFDEIVPGEVKGSEIL